MNKTKKTITLIRAVDVNRKSEISIGVIAPPQSTVLTPNRTSLNIYQTIWVES